MKTKHLHYRYGHFPFVGQTYSDKRVCDSSHADHHRKIIKDAILTSWRYASMERDLSSFIELSIGYETWPIMVVTVSEGNLIKLSPLL